MNQANPRTRYQREQATTQAELITQDPPSLAAAHSVFHRNTLAGQMLVLFLLRVCQFRRGFTFLTALPFVGQDHLVHTDIAQVGTTRCSGILFGRFTLAVESLIRNRTRMTWFNGKHLTRLVSDHLRFERVSLLLTRVKPALDIVQARTSNRCLKAVNQDNIYGVRMPGRLFLGPFLLGVPAMIRASVA